MKKIYTDEQIVGFIREAEKSEVTISEFCRQKGFNEGTFYKWKKRFGTMQVAEVKRLRELEAENARLKRPEMPTTAKPGESCASGNFLSSSIA